MRFLHLKTAILLVQLCLCISCGYGVPEKDKYPEMPEYNGFDPNLFVVDTLLTDIDKHAVIYDRTDGFIYCHRPMKEEFFLLDKSLKIKEKLNVKGTFIGNKTFYEVEGDIFNPVVYKYVYPWKKRIKVNELKKMEYDSVVKNYDIPKDKRGKYDVYVIRDVNRQYMDSLLGGLKETINLRDYIICLGNKEEYFLRARDYKWYYGEERPKKTDFFDYILKEQINKNLIEFDRVTLGNDGGGNHFFFWYIPYGYDYYTFKIGNDSIQFKWNSKGLRTIVQVKDLWGDRILIYRDGENRGELYNIRKK